MMAVFTSYLDKKISLREYIKNILIITFANFLGAIFVAYAFGHIVGLTSTGVFLEETLHLTSSKLSA